MSGRVCGYWEAAILLVIGLGSLGLAASESYARLMNPSFRGVTVGGALLVTAMGLTLAIRPRRGGGLSTVLVFSAFLAAAVLGRPLAPGISPTRPADASAPAVERAGYEPRKTETLFQTFREEAAEVEEGKFAFSGLVHRTAESEARGHFILLEPMMACCLADAIALGVRVQASAPLPEAGAWVHVFGRLRVLEQPVATPRFRLGAILFTVVSRFHLLEADEVVPFRALLPDVVAKVPVERCGVFLRALEATGLAARLRADGPFTVFAAPDLGFDRLPDAERARLFATDGRRRLRALLEDFVVAGHYAKDDLHGVEELTTLSGRVLRVDTVNGQVRVEGARILFGDQLARNGVLHVVHPPWFER